jgi:hypothetical protein
MVIIIIHIKGFHEDKTGFIWLAHNNDNPKYIVNITIILIVIIITTLGLQFNMAMDQY